MWVMLYSIACALECIQRSRIASIKECWPEIIRHAAKNNMCAQWIIYICKKTWISAKHKYIIAKNIVRIWSGKASNQSKIIFRFKYCLEINYFFIVCSVATTVYTFRYNIKTKRIGYLNNKQLWEIRFKSEWKWSIAFKRLDLPIV